MVKGKTVSKSKRISKSKFVRKIGTRPGVVNIPVEMISHDKTLSGFAYWDKLDKKTVVAITDADKKLITTIEQHHPFKAKKIIIEERVSGELIIEIRGKKKQETIIKNYIMP